MAGLTTVTSGGILDGTITNADINSSAAIDASKVSGLSTDSITEGNTSVEVVDTGSDGHILFDTEGSERMRITSSGDVGIGTSGFTPSAKLHVHGGYLRLGNGATAFPDGVSGPIIYGSNQGGSGLFSAVGNLILQGRSDSSNASNTNIAFVTGDTPTERMRIDSSGNVGIGTTSPSTKLEVEGDNQQIRVQVSSSKGVSLYGGSSSNTPAITYDETLRFFDNGSGDGERMRIASDGRLLLGATSTPTNSSALFVVHGLAGNANEQGTMRLQRNNNNGNNNRIGVIEFGGSDSAAAEIRGVGDGTWASNDYPGRLEFYTTADGASSSTERMRIDSSGRVGIGTNSNSTYNLQVAGSSSGNQFAIGDSSPRLILDYKSPSSTTVCPQLTSDGEGLYYYGKHNNGNSAHKFHAGSSNAEKVRIDTDGLKFNGDTSSVNALDDYEEGTWSPNFHSNSSSNQVTYDVREGTYTKIGNTVYIRARVTYTNRGSTDSTHNARMAGLPFTSKNTQGGFYYVMPVARPTNSGDVDLYLLSGNSTTGIFARATTAVAQWADFDTSTNGTGGYIICGSYLAA